jgi:hypothetical protein
MLKVTAKAPLTVTLMTLNAYAGVAPRRFGR